MTLPVDQASNSQATPSRGPSLDKVPESLASFGSWMGSKSGASDSRGLRRRAFLGFLFFLVAGFLNFAPLSAWGLNPFVIALLLLMLALVSFGILGFCLFRYGAFCLKGGRWQEPELISLIAVLLDLSYSSFILITGQGNGSYPLFLTLHLILAGNYVLALPELKTWAQTDAAIRSLLNLYPVKARLLLKNQEQEINVSDLKVGDVVTVPVGEVIPCDGIIVSGTTSVDESRLLAERTILLKKKDDMVIGASINRDSPIQVKVIKPLQEHFLHQWVRSLSATVHEGGKPSGFIRHLPFSLALFFTAAVGAAFGLGVLSLDPFMARVVSAWGFLGLVKTYQIIPHVQVKGILQSALRAILVRSPALFKKITGLHYLFFDKTGTLTKGDLSFSQLYLEKGVNQGSLLSMLFSLESHSDHPLARAMVTHPWYVEITKFPVVDFKYHAGLGICGKVLDREGNEWFGAVGNQRFLKRFQMQISRGMRERIDELESVGETVILCGWEGQARGLVSFVDTLRSDVKPLLASLTRLKIEPIMITGDHDEMIAHLTYAHGLKHVYTRCLPAEKANKIKNRQEKSRLVGMVSNSVEEAAFNQADVGVIVGNGTNFPEKAPGVIIFGRQLLTIQDMVQISQVVTRTVKADILSGSVLAAVVLPLLALGFSGPLGPILSSLIVSWAAIHSSNRVLQFQSSQKTAE